MDARTAWVAACAVVVLVGCREQEKAKREAAGAHPDAGEWTPRMYAALAEEVKTDCNKATVPKLGSDAFADLIDARNIDAFDKVELAPRERFPRMMELTGPVNQLMKAYFKCGRTAEMLLVGTFFLDAYSRILPDLDEYMVVVPPDDPSHAAQVAGRDEVLAGLRDMLTGFFTMLKVPPFDLSEMDPFASRVGAVVGDVGRYLPADWWRVQLDSLRNIAASTTDPKHRSFIETVIAAATQ